MRYQKNCAIFGALKFLLPNPEITRLKHIVCIHLSFFASRCLSLVWALHLELTFSPFDAMPFAAGDSDTAACELPYPFNYCYLDPYTAMPHLARFTWATPAIFKLL